MEKQDIDEILSKSNVEWSVFDPEKKLGNHRIIDALASVIKAAFKLISSPLIALFTRNEAVNVQREHSVYLYERPRMPERSQMEEVTKEVHERQRTLERPRMEEASKGAHERSQIDKNIQTKALPKDNAEKARYILSHDDKFSKKEQEALIKNLEKESKKNYSKGKDYVAERNEKELNQKIETVNALMSEARLDDNLSLFGKLEKQMEAIKTGMKETELDHYKDFDTIKIGDKDYWLSYSAVGKDDITVALFDDKHNLLDSINNQSAEKMNSIFAKAIERGPIKNIDISFDDYMKTDKADRAEKYPNCFNNLMKKVEVAASDVRLSDVGKKNKITEIIQNEKEALVNNSLRSMENNSIKDIMFLSAEIVAGAVMKKDPLLIGAEAVIKTAIKKNETKSLDEVIKESAMEAESINNRENIKVNTREDKEVSERA